MAKTFKAYNGEGHAGYEFSGKRLGKSGYFSPGKWTKSKTHKAERRQAQKEIADADHR